MSLDAKTQGQLRNDSLTLQRKQCAMQHTKYSINIALWNDQDLKVGSKSQQSLPMPGIVTLTT